LFDANRTLDCAHWSNFLANASIRISVGAKKKRTIAWHKFSTGAVNNFRRSRAAHKKHNDKQAACDPPSRRMNRPCVVATALNETGLAASTKLWTAFLLAPQSPPAIC
jgi:hypothetical protein